MIDQSNRAGKLNVNGSEDLRGPNLSYVPTSVCMPPPSSPHSTMTKRRMNTKRSRELVQDPRKFNRRSSLTRSSIDLQPPVLSYRTKGKIDIRKSSPTEHLTWFFCLMLPLNRLYTHTYIHAYPEQRFSHNLHFLFPAHAQKGRFIDFPPYFCIHVYICICVCASCCFITYSNSNSFCHLCIK